MSRIPTLADHHYLVIGPSPRAELPLARID